MAGLLLCFGSELFALRDWVFFLRGIGFVCGRSLIDSGRIDKGISTRLVGAAGRRIGHGRIVNRGRRVGGRIGSRLLRLVSRRGGGFCGGIV